MNAKHRNICIDQGSDYNTPFFLADDSGAPLNLLGVTAVMQIRRAYDDPEPVLTLTTADGSLSVDGLNGTVTPHIGEDATAALTPGVYVYDLKLLETNGRTVRPRQGYVTVNQQVTTIEPPTPSPSPSPSPAPSYVAMENVGNVLQEDGTKILTEVQP